MTMWRKFLNPFMCWLLHSPFHVFVSQHIMLIQVIGRKSGQVYSTPIDYRKEGSTVYAMTSKKYAWWKNLRGGAEVQLVIQGKPRIGRAQTSAEPRIMLDTLQKMYPKRSGLEHIAPGCIAIHINLV